MNSKFLTLVGVATVLSLATYFGLNFYYPYQKEEQKVTSPVAVDDVFSGGLQQPPATAETTAEPTTAPTPTPEPAEAAVATAAEPAATPEPAATAAPAAKPAPAEEPAAVIPTVEPTPEPTAAVPKKQAKPKSKPAPKPSVAAATPPQPAAAKTPASAEPPKNAAAPAVEETAWWGKPDAASLSLVYAGSAAKQKAIVLLFNGAFDTPDSANSNLAVYNDHGLQVNGGWQVGPSNKHMLVFAVENTGRYTVVLKTGFKDSEGRALARASRGPVQVR